MNDHDFSPIRRLAIHARTHPDRVALVYEGRRITFRELHERARALAGTLVAHGVGLGDRTAYIGLNSSTLVAAYLACTWIGAVFVPVNFRLAAPEMVSVLTDCAPALLLAEPEYAALLDTGIDDSIVPTRLVIDDDPGAGPFAGLGSSCRPLADLLGCEEAPAALERSSHDLAALLYTSGTTGRPKGVVMTLGNIWWNQANVDAVVDTRADDVYLALGPMSHIGGLNSFMLGGLARGATTVIRRRVEPAQVLRDLVAEGVTGLFAVPAILASVQRLAEFDEADLSRLRAAVVGGAPVPPTLIASFARKGVTIQQSWGMTETSSFGTYLDPADVDTRPDSAGLPMPYMDLRIVNVETGADCAAGTAGEIWVRGPNVVSGYWNNPEATSAAFVGDGWFRTGDIGTCDTDGYVSIVDRLNDVIISGGENIYPAEVERALAAHPAVAEVGVIGAPDQRWGETVVAVVGLLDGSTLTLDGLRDFAAARLARYKLPTRLVVIDELPRTASGKLDRAALRAAVAEGSEP